MEVTAIDLAVAVVCPIEVTDVVVATANVLICPIDGE